MDVRRWLIRLGALSLLGAAAFSVLPSLAVQWLACENEGTEACSRQSLADVVPMVAVAGLLPAILLVWDAWRGRRRALIWLAVGLAVYAFWAILLDAAVHGWDDLKLLGR
jgi:hypothetical protein